MVIATEGAFLKTQIPGIAEANDESELFQKDAGLARFMQRVEGCAVDCGLFGKIRWISPAFGRSRFSPALSQSLGRRRFAGRRDVCECSGGLTPHQSGDEARYALQGEAQDILRRA